MERHLSREHEWLSDEIRLAIQALEEIFEFSEFNDPNISILNIPADPPINPIQGLPIMKGISCSLCPYVCTNINTLKRHWTDTHGSIPTPTSFPTTFIQSLSNFKGLPCFPVDYIPPSTLPTITQREIHELVLRVNPIRGPNDTIADRDTFIMDGHLPKFTQVVGWLEAVQGHQWSLCRSLLTVVGAAEPFYKRSSVAVRHYLNKIHCSIRNIVYDVRILYGSPTEYEYVLHCLEKMDLTDKVLKYKCR